jgi:PRTRC genetic system ThiF family protein
MKTNKTPVHFTDKLLLDPEHPLTVTVIGAGGTGSNVIAGLARINASLRQLDHPGLQVTVLDDDRVTAANSGRQLFATSEIGLYKCEALINRVNRFFGTSWKAVPEKVTSGTPAEKCLAQVLFTAVDTVEARFTVEQLLKKGSQMLYPLLQPLYWMDFGNSQYTGQVLLSTVHTISQPRSRKFQPVDALPFVTKEYAHELNNKKEDHLASCSVAEALNRQDLFINATLANMGCSLFWNMLKEGMIHYRGFFVNLKTFETHGVPLLNNNTLAF